MYYQGNNSEIQGEGLQTLYLMNPNYSSYSDTSQQSGNMMIMNYQTGNGINLESLPNGNQSQPQDLQHLVGVPLHGGSMYSSTTTASRGGSGGGGYRSISNLHPSLWGSLDNENQENSRSSGGGGGGGQAEVSVAHLGYHHLHHLPVVSPTRQGLSLSLSSQQQQQQHPININQVGMVSPKTGGGNFQLSGGGACTSVSMNTNGLLPGASSFVLGSKYLKAAQELLDEVVSILGKEIKAEINEKAKTTNKESIMVLRGETASMATELTTAQKQEIQMKKAKLITMLDEVEQRYTKYHHQMQVVVTSFEQDTGVGSARSYTQIALKTISKQFRCLKDAISAQIKTASKNLGEEGIHGSSSRLKFVDQQLRQQKDLQHFGMIHTNNAWRPQRGLPERAVSVLRAWLFEHFLHPYPKDSDKIMLAKQTGLTRSQVSNWFINARVRLWKPMVEEMYTEETKNNETMGSDCNKKDHLATTKSLSPKDVNKTMIITDEDINTKSKKENRNSHPIQEATHDLEDISRFGLVSELNNSDHVNMMGSKYNDPRVIGNGLIGAFSFGDLENFNPGFHGNNGNGGGGGGGSAVSLTLGLPPSDQHNFFSNQDIELRSTHHMNIGYNETLLQFPNS